jgi:hypothetical protein
MLKERGRKGQTYDEIIRELIEGCEKIRLSEPTKSIEPTETAKEAN